MNKDARAGVYIWMKTTHKKGRHTDIIDAISTALSEGMGRVRYGIVLGDGSTTGSGDLVRSLFVAWLNPDEMGNRATSSPFHLNSLADMQGAVNSSTGDDKRSNCRIMIMPYPPEGIMWLMREADN